MEKTTFKEEVSSGRFWADVFKSVIIVVLSAALGGAARSYVESKMKNKKDGQQ